MNKTLIGIFSLDLLSLRLKLLLFAIGTSIFVSTALSLMFVFFARKTILHEIQVQLGSIRETKKDQLNTYFSHKKSDTFVLANSSDVKLAFLEFENSYKQLVKSQSQNSVEYYLQDRYIAKNPYPAGKRQDFEDPKDGSNYAAVHRKHQNFFRNYIKEKNFYDLFLIDLDGNIIYSVFKEKDFATNLANGRYKETNLANLFLRIRDSKNIFEVQFVDFQNYLLSSNEPASFIGAPIVISGKTVGVLALQMPVDEIDSYMDNDFLGNVGAVYLIGQDGFFRTTDHRYPDTKFILRQKNETNAVKYAFEGQSGVIEEENYKGDLVFVAYMPLQILGVNFALLSEHHKDYALKPLHDLTHKVGVILGVITIIIAFLTFLTTRIVTTPILGAINILSSSTREIAATVEEQEKTAKRQSASVNETSTTMAELGSSAKHSAEQAVAVSYKSKEAQETAEIGSVKVDEMMASMTELREKVHIISEQILQLSEKNSQISGIIGLVSDIANQTNMLALNAAVEAARAGEAGKGFAVVAVEIRKLADESKRSADKIQEILFEIKKATDSTVMATEEASKKVEASVSLGRDVASAFEGIMESIGNVFASTEQITLNVKQQSIAINEVVQSLTGINRGSSETAIGITQTKTGIQQVKVATDSLKKLVEGTNVNSV